MYQSNRFLIDFNYIKNVFGSFAAGVKNQLQKNLNLTKKIHQVLPNLKITLKSMMLK